MRAAAWPRDEAHKARLLVLDARTGSFQDRFVADLPELLRAGDLLVVNDAATLPASFTGSTTSGPVEVRLAAAGASEREWKAVLFGAGTWRERTEDRGAPPTLAAGDMIRLDGLAA